MSQEKLRQAQQLLKAKRYDEARAILNTLDDPTARKWLARLDELVPEAEFPESGPQRRNGISNSVILASLSAMLLITFVIALYGAFLRPVGAAEAQDSENATQMISELVNVNAQLQAIVENTGSDPIQWEYLILTYNQYAYPILNKISEVISTNVPEYTSLFDDGCDLTSSTYDECKKRNFKGLSYYVETLGLDSWELVGINNVSTDQYSVELFFKRPK